MSHRTVAPERVFVGVSASGIASVIYRGQVANEIGTALWTCPHRHVLRAVAVRCAEAERRRWLRAGKGRP